MPSQSSAALVSFSRKNIKTNRKSKLLPAVAAVVAGMVSLSGVRSVQAVDQFYDGDGVGAVNGGSGMWDTSSLRWGATNVDTTYTTFSSDNNAVFGGTSSAATVGINDAIQASIKVTSGDYYFHTLIGGFNWQSAGGVLDVEPGAKMQFNVVGGGNAGGLTVQGGGSVGFYGNLYNSAGPVLVTGNTTLYYAHPNAALVNLNTIDAGSTIDLRWINDTWLNLSGSGTVRGEAKPLELQTTGNTLTIGSNTNLSSTFSGTITDDNGGVAGIFNNGMRVTKQGTGLLLLNGTNTFHGPLRITETAAGNAGILAVAGGSAVPDTSAVVFGRSGATVTSTFDIQSSETIGSLGGQGGVTQLDGGTLTLGGDNYNMDWSGTLTGSGLIVKNGGGSQGFTGLSSPVNTYTGKYVINNGSMNFGGDARMGAVPGANTPDFITLAGGTLANTPAGGFAMAATRGITVSSASGIFVTGSGASPFTVQGQITGAAGLTKTGVGQLILAGDNTATYTGDWTINEGLVATTSTNNGSPMGTGNLNISRSTLSMIPATGAGAVVAQSYANGSGKGLTFGPGTILNINKGNATASFTATIGDPAATGGAAFTRGSRGTMLITAASGFANLGTAGNETLMVNGGINTVATNATGGGPNSIIPGVILSTGSGATEGSFATYNNTNGLVQATYSTNAISSSASDDVVSVNTIGGGTVSLSAPANAYALRIGAGGTTGNVLDLNGQTLNIGNGAASDPGMLIVNTGSNIAATGGGTINFGSHEGVIYAQGATNNSGQISGTIAGSNGLTKMGYGPLTLNAAAAYTGITRVSQGKLTLGASNVLPASTDVVLDSGINSTTLNSVLNLNGNSQSVNSISSTFGSTSTTVSAPQIALGSGGTLQITGSGNTTYMGGMTGTNSSMLWVNGMGKLTLGVADSVSGSTSAVMTYDKLKITGGGTVSVSSANSMPGITNSPTSPQTDTITLDNGTLVTTSFTPNGAFGSGNSSSFGLPSTNKGITIGSGGGTINVANPLEIALGNSTGASINGAGTLTIGGKGTFRGGSYPNFTGKIVVDGAALQITADTSFGAVPGLFVPDAITLKDGGILACDSANLNGAGISANRGIFIDSTGGVLRQAFALELHAPLSGSGPLTRWSSTSSNGFLVLDASADGTFPGATGPYTGTVTLASAAQTIVNADNALGTGTITNNPEFPDTLATSVGSGLNTNLVNHFILNKGSAFDFRVNSAGASMTLLGQVSGDANWFKGANGGNSGDLILANGSNNFTGTVTVSFGQLIPTANGALGSTAAPMVVDDTGAIAFKGNLNYTAAKPLILSQTLTSTGAINNISDDNTFAGPITMASSVTVNNNGGTLSLTGGITGASDSILTANINGNGPLHVKNIRTGGLTVSNGTVHVLPSGRSAASTSVLASAPVIDGSSQLDIEDNALIVTYDPNDNSHSVRDNIRNLLVNGRNGAAGQPGAWNGLGGITSSYAHNNGNGFNLAIGYGDNEDIALVRGSGSYTSFGGQTVASNTVLIQMTRGADATLDGVVDAQDVTILGSHFNKPNSGQWVFGDFDYSGTCDATDVTTLGSTFGKTTPTLSPAQMTAEFGAAFTQAFEGGQAGAVPEPASLTMLGLGGVALIGRRRRKAKA